jgi:hypothetical protein
MMKCVNLLLSNLTKIINMLIVKVLASLLFVPNVLSFKGAFVPSARGEPVKTANNVPSASGSKVGPLHFFGKVFEESGPLGKGITVGKVQVCLNSKDRSPTSITGMLESKAKSTGDSPQALSRLANEVSLALLRKSDDWMGACSSSEWFSEKDSGKAESLFNEWANREAAKFEKVSPIIYLI